MVLARRYRKDLLVLVDTTTKNKMKLDLGKNTQIILYMMHDHHPTYLQSKEFNIKILLAFPEENIFRFL